MIEQVKKLCSLAGVSGDEGKVYDYIYTKAVTFADEIHTDAMGNLFVFRAGKRRCKKPLMLCAHMDEVGFIIKRITDEGMLQFDFVGGIDPRAVIGRRVRFGDVHGVVGIKAVHLSRPEERKTMPSAKELYIDIGATSKAQAENKVSLGDYGVFDSEICEFGKELLQAKALDDRVGCAVLLQLLRKTPAVDTWFVFTVQEEVGFRGATTAAFAQNPALCLVIEGTTAADFPEVPEHRQVCALRKGVVLPFMDKGTIYDKKLFQQLRTLAEKHQIPWQLKQAVSGATDAGAIHKSKTGIPSAVIAVPVRYIHSACSVASIQDIQHIFALAQAFLDSFTEQTDFI